MRFVMCLAAVLPMPGLADVFTIPSQATEAIVYPQGGLVTHEIVLTAEAGVHEVILPNLPPNVSLDDLRIAADDLQIGTLRFRSNFVPPTDGGNSDEIKAAEARIEEVEAQIQAVRDAATRLLLAQSAAEARITFLTGLGDSDALPSDAGALAQIGAMVSTEVLAAREAALDAEIASRAELQKLKPLKEDLANAKAALDALVPEDDGRPFLSVQVAAAQAVEDTPIRVSFFIYDAGWLPTYNLRLSDGDPAKLTIERGADVMQRTGENWQDVALVLSTQRPSDQIEPSFLPEDRRRMFDPDELAKVRTRAASPAMMDVQEESMAGMSVQQAPVVLQAAEGQALGLSVVYDVPGSVDVASGADAARIPFDVLEYDAEVFARAVPMRDDTAYLVARFTHDSPEPLLPSIHSQRFFEGGLIGSTGMPMVAAGDEVELGFGAIDGLKLTRTVLERAEGDRGLISRSNEQSEDVKILVENLSSRDWQVELLDRVPYSEQEDLEITYTAQPAPDVRGLDDRRGILQWNIDLKAGADATITTKYQMSWPDGKVVR